MSFPTWSDLNDESLIPPLGQRYAPDLGSVAVMVSTEPDVRYIEANSGKKTSLPFFLGKLFTLDGGQISFAGPYLGSPYAAMILESLIARGVSKVVVIGWCGSLSDQLQTGDILIPDSAICDEGTSRNYMVMPDNTDFPTVFPDSHFTSKLRSSLESRKVYIAKRSWPDSSTSDYEKQICFHGKERSTDKERSGEQESSASKNIHCDRARTIIHCRRGISGRVWTTDAIYRETQKKVAFFRDMGALAVEMECSALFAVAAYRKIDIAALLIVSDDLSSPEWKPGFKSVLFKESRKKVLGSIADVMTDLMFD
ncbi:MAG: nucleoside phosphorylase [Desulfamplus sp.]|nr:nucleoside phosphorylase [Desulfamplus sp.]MBF0259772.1 nucleoside phosphorylase [Desulfamplus sp.]